MKFIRICLNTRRLHDYWEFFYSLLFFIPHWLITLHRNLVRELHPRFAIYELPTLTYVRTSLETIVIFGPSINKLWVLFANLCSGIIGCHGKEISINEWMNCGGVAMHCENILDLCACLGSHHLNPHRIQPAMVNSTSPVICFVPGTRFYVVMSLALLRYRWLQEKDAVVGGSILARDRTLNRGMLDVFHRHLHIVLLYSLIRSSTGVSWFRLCGSIVMGKYWINMSIKCRRRSGRNWICRTMRR